MGVRKIDTKADFDALIASDKLVVVDFFATWCGPCKMIAPKVEMMSESYPDVVFAKVDVDENDETAEFCEISAMPTFLLFKKGAKVDTLTGANEEKLKQLIETYK